MNILMQFTGLQKLKLTEEPVGPNSLYAYFLP